MLKHRVWTAIALLLVFVAVLLAPWQVFVGFVWVVMFVATWEWSALTGLRYLWQRYAYVAFSLLLFGLASFFVLWSKQSTHVKTVAIIGVVWWALALLWIQGYPSSRILWRSPLARMVMGWAVLIPAFLCCQYLVLSKYGPVSILAVVAIVAAADIGGYFFGRAFGKHKLAPKVSPGKSWEGVFGGVVAVLTLGLIINYLFIHISVASSVATLLAVGLVSVVGDLLESMVKRESGVKDSGSILPGHGGVLDRIDGLVAALPVFTLALIHIYSQGA